MNPVQRTKMNDFLEPWKYEQVFCVIPHRLYNGDWCLAKVFMYNPLISDTASIALVGFSDGNVLLSGYKVPDYDEICNTWYEYLYSGQYGKLGDVALEMGIPVNDLFEFYYNMYAKHAEQDVKDRVQAEWRNG